ncbi:hypothetical protein [Phenylobacterium sp. SCN 70-31]|uniref:hypothetical protein n=1 Tax=Phenylobacterium sp. SCN 70-31 TaxID=1660129 RepID=UPI0008694436|nr:hypothetical protein [Phenylobacterium sp. SCN 70-31]ODT88824.1 MAG: hypothetical protein ABS78_06630 [Phenylobacterium sp. SCN 70-31]
MSLIDRIPTLADDEVATFLANARRLAESGDDKQRAAAAELVPALEAEAEARHDARQERAKAKRAATRRATLRSQAA